MPIWPLSLLSRETFGWPSLPTFAFDRPALPSLPSLPLLPVAPTAVAPLVPRPGTPAGPRPALPAGAEESGDLLRAMPTRIIGGPAAPPHSHARGGAPHRPRGASGGGSGTPGPRRPPRQPPRP